MLVLSRQRDETIMIGDDIEITVVDIRGDKVRLGITAPTRIAVHRKEVYEAIKTENERASRLSDADTDLLRTASAQNISPGPTRNRIRGSLSSGAHAPLPSSSPSPSASSGKPPEAETRRARSA